MKIYSKKFLEYVVFSMAGGLISSFLAIICCCMIFLFILIPILPIVFICSWMAGSVIGWISALNELSLPKHSYMWSLLAFAIISSMLLYHWLYPNSLRYCVGYTVLSSFGFAVCSFPVAYYIKKRIIPEIFLPPLPKSKKNING